MDSSLLLHCYTDDLFLLSHQLEAGENGGHTLSSGLGFLPVGAYYDQPLEGFSLPPSETGRGLRPWRMDHSK
ncbi:hypothetical protein AN958_11924 [Leucoagaricus sp. SymC.cos]|nr:hypothetical protein AN958_11924 [Leucoagaricus sp. SymC.cos]